MPSTLLPFTLTPALPELVLLVTACTILLVEAWATRGERRPEALARPRAAGYVLALLGLLTAAGLTLFVGWGQSVRAFGGLFVDDPFADLLKFVTYAAAIVAVIYSRQYLAERGLMRGEYFALLLFAVLGMLVMISAAHLLSLYLGLELLSLALYALVAFRRDDAVAVEAAMKYFVLGALASGLLLYGMSLMYGLTGTLELAAMAESLASGVKNPVVLAFAVVFLVAGVGFKLGTAPFHMWVPDVYHGAPTAVTLFIGSAPKLAAFAFVMRLLVDGLQPAVADWQQMLAVMAVLSLALGNLAAIMQDNLKRMLAYSTIAHMGFLLLGVLTAEVEGYGAALYYVVVYVLMSLGAFGLILHLAREGHEADAIDDYKGLNARAPWLAALMGIMMLSMSGLPPFVGFWAKLAVLEVLVAAGWTWLAVLAVLFSLIGAYYYLRVVWRMYFDPPHSLEPPVTGQARALLSVNGLAVLALGIVPQPLIALCLQAMQATYG
ncbi:MAG: NADH-quinone oxidoreductase subunit NuoN [Thiobacillaceae bacterium]|nr:NADH-quinone oxidoreductase subunit NuoN [Thiobacillaceae bacterium]